MAARRAVVMERARKVRPVSFRQLAGLGTPGTAQSTLHEKLDAIETLMPPSKLSRRAEQNKQDLEGFERPLLLTIVMATVTWVLSVYGIYKYTKLLHGDVYGGARCATCSIRPYRVCLYSAMTVGAVTTMALGVADFISTRTLYMSPKTVNLGKLLRLRYHMVYEVLQFAWSVLGLISWNYGMVKLALIDVPGDPMHLLYVHGARPKCTVDQPCSEDNPLSVSGDHLDRFYRLEMVVLWGVAVNACFCVSARLGSPRTADRISSATCFDLVELGVLLGLAYPRILDAWDWNGPKVNAFSPFVIGGFFRCMRVLRMERAVSMLYGRTGIETPFFTANGVLVRYYLLIVKCLTIFVSFAVIICTVEYPCAPNAIRHNSQLELDSCNAWFRRVDQCIYFLTVTLSTVGYGDMYPATREGRFVMIVMILFIILAFPTLMAEIQELSDGDDTSDIEKIQIVSTSAWKDVAVLSAKIEDVMRTLQRPAQLPPSTKTTPADNHVDDDPPHPHQLFLPDESLAAITRHLDDLSLKQAELVRHVGDALKAIAASEQQTATELERLRALMHDHVAQAHAPHRPPAPTPTSPKAPPPPQQQPQTAVSYVQRQVLAPTPLPEQPQQAPKLYLHDPPQSTSKYFVQVPEPPANVLEYVLHDKAPDPHVAQLPASAKLAPPKPYYYFKPDHADVHDLLRTSRRKHRHSSSKKHKVSSRKHLKEPDDVPPNRPLPGFYTQLPDSKF